MWFILNFSRFILHKADLKTGGKGND